MFCNWIDKFTKNQQNLHFLCSWLWYFLNESYLKISYYFTQNQQNSWLNVEIWTTPQKIGKVQVCNFSRLKYKLSLELIFFKCLIFFCLNKLLFLRKSAKFVINCWNMNLFHGWYLLNTWCFCTNTLIRIFLLLIV